MALGRLWKAMIALATASVLSAGAAQALSVDLITNGTFESGSLSGWSTTGNAAGETFVVNDGTPVNNPRGLPFQLPSGLASKLGTIGKSPEARGGRIEPISGLYDTIFRPVYSGVATLTQYFTVPDEVISATFDFTARVGLFGLYSDPNHQFRVSVVDQLGDVIQEVYATATGGIQLGNGTATTLTFDLTTLLQANQGQTLGVQFALEAQTWQMNVSLDDIAMMVETPATVPLPASAWMMLAGLGLFGALGWKQRRRAGEGGAPS
jgi:PEP-CTERM motif.